MSREEAGPLTDMQREYLGTILENVQRMTTELKGLSELAKPEPLRFSFFDLTAVWSDVLRRRQGQAEAIQARIETQFSHRPFPMAADAALLSNALDSVLGYVLRRTAPAGQVGVRFDRNDEIVVRVATRERKNFDEEGSSATGTISGDELALARSAMRLHGGGVPVARGDGNGLTVTLTFPLIIWKLDGLEDLDVQAFHSCSG